MADDEAVFLSFINDGQYTIVGRDKILIRALTSSGLSPSHARSTTTT